MPLHRVWEHRDIGRLFITVGGGESDNRGAEMGLGGGDSPGQSGGHSPASPATLWQCPVRDGAHEEAVGRSWRRAGAGVSGWGAVVEAARRREGRGGEEIEKVLGAATREKSHA